MNMKTVTAGILFVILVFFSAYKLTESPPTWYDEGIYNQIAENQALGHGQQVQISPDQYISSSFVTGGYPFLTPISWSFRVFGIGLLQARIVMVLFIIATAAAFFFLIKKLFGINQTLISLALIATFPLLYGDGKNVLGEVPGLLYFSLFLIFLRRFEEYHGLRRSDYLWMGLFGGLCLATKPIFFLLGGAVILAYLFNFRRFTKKVQTLASTNTRIDTPPVFINLASLILGAVAFIVPMSLWMYFQFSRNDSASHVLSYYANPYGLTNMSQVVIQNALRFFHESTPVYFLILGLIWLVAVVIRQRLKKPISLVECVTFIFSILVALAYLRTAGWYRYLFVALVPMLAFLPHSLTIISAWLSQWKPAVAKYARFLPAAILVVFLAMHAYQMLFASWTAEHYSSTITASTEKYFHSLPPHSTFYVYNTPQAVIFLPNQNYYQYIAPTETMQYGTDTFAVLDRGVPDYLVVDEHFWPDVQARFPRYATSTMVAGSFVVASIPPQIHRPNQSYVAY
jgi:4-amino-4-deoxy-L-arabinose transferase-like glycosyltransferase